MERGTCVECGSVLTGLLPLDPGVFVCLRAHLHPYALIAHVAACGRVQSCESLLQLDMIDEHPCVVVRAGEGEGKGEGK